MPNTDDLRGVTKIEKFFLFCAAADLEILKECPKNETNKYIGVGVTIFATGLLAAFSGGYALFTAFKSIPLAASLGIFWGILVFNLDRFIVSTIKKSKSKSREIIQVFPRLFLAILLSLVISTPLELKIFEDEINEQLYYTEAKKLDRLDSLYQKRINVKQEEITRLKQDLNKKLEVRDKYYEEYICECDGTCGTGQIGRGSECERKEKKYLKSDEEYRELKLGVDTDAQNIKEEVKSLKIELMDKKERLKSTLADGLLARMEALKELPYGTQLAIILLLIAVEIAPIFVKLLTPYGPYDHLLRTIEYRFEIDEITSVNMRNQELNNKLTVLASMEQQKVDQEIKNNEGALKLIGEAHLELVKDQLQIWLEEEKEKIQQKKKTL